MGYSAPVDDGAADHLIGLEFPDFSLESTSGAAMRPTAALVSHSPLLNDASLFLSRPPLMLPTFTVGGMTLYKRITLIVNDGLVEHVFYPVHPPERNAADVISWLERQV